MLDFQKYQWVLIVIIVQLVYILHPVSAASQSVNAKKIDGSLTVDGKLIEPDWDNADIITNFTQIEPRKGEAATLKTYVKVLYNDRMVYFGIDCKDSEPDKISTKVTKRDGEVYEDDAIAIIIDTFNDDNNGYMFQVNALGTQQDERWADNGRTRDTKWDIKWMSAGAINEDGWTAEIAIPFEVLKFNRNTKEWGLDIIRYIPRNLEQSHWIPDLTEWFRISEFGAVKELDLRNVITKNYTIIPYAQAQLEKGQKSTGEIGGDIRYNLSSNIGLDVTFNPDFATIEGDVEQVNLTRFELSYPEKRPFFMEGAENYSTRIRQFYSRRVGEIPWGAKLNGKIDKWKINMLNTKSDPSTVNSSVSPGKEAYYTVFRVNREIYRSSNIGLIGANRSYDEKNKGSVGLVATLFFTKVLGMTSQFIKSYGDYEEGSWTYFVRPSYDSQTFHFHVRFTHVGENVRENMNDIGFIRDDDRREVDSNIRKRFWINKHGIEEINPSVNYNQYWSQTGTMRSWDLSNNLTVKFLRKWQFRLSYREEYKLFEKEFRNSSIEPEIKFDNKAGKSVTAKYGFGTNYERNFEKYGVGINLKLIEGLNAGYNLTRIWFRPDEDQDGSWIHYIRSTYYINKDLYFKLFYQSKYNLTGGISDAEFDLSRNLVQFVFVWRFFPPFGSIQLAYQQGQTRVTEVEGRNKTLFSKFSWVF